MTEHDRSEFWSERYQTGRTGWDLGIPAPNVQRLVSEWAPAGGRILVPGCGRGYDARALAQKGFEVTALDFAPEAIAEAKRLAEEEEVNVEWVRDDLFADRREWEASFDAWVELTCFCAIDPSRREAYVEQAFRWVKPGGLLLAVIFSGIGAGGPPFDSDPADLRALFGRSFEVLKAGWSPDSVPERQGKEWEMVMRRGVDT